ncbi:TadE/TadG family type IV pilus assembly protein [Rhodobacter sp. NSM]|uniref:TadE/TadG family type IV pilus assembly protein n=1 Tax=Rhodobacter sp. NSM TaxID=3457501 RepID=UPI003FD2C444
MTAWPRWLRRHALDEGGTASVEFVLVFPIIMSIFFAAMESGLYMTRSVLFDRALDMAVRDLRVGLIEDPTLDKLKSAVCDQMTMMQDCATAIRIELTLVDTAIWDFPTDAITCVDRSKPIAPVLEPDYGVANDIMVVRACVPADAMFPSTGIAAGLPKDGKGGYYVVAYSAFVNEP